MWQSYLLVGLGGGVGAVLRYGVSLALMSRFNGYYPVGTLAVNLLGSLLLGFFHEFALTRTTLSSDARLMISVGLLGAFTTFSTFARETVVLLQEGNLKAALVYSGGSVVVGAVMVVVGMLLAALVTSR